MFYPRLILKKLEREIDTREIIVITGMRQVGKTTILSHIFSKIKSNNKFFFDLENPLHRKIFEEENFDNIWNNLATYNLTNKEKAYLFIDEIQNLPSIVKIIKYFYDHYQVKFFITGSSSFYLKNLFPESLAGRKLIFELFPLTFSEFLIFKNKNKNFCVDFKKKIKMKNKIVYELYKPYYLEYLKFGGFPKVVLEEDRGRKKRILEEIFISYFEKDVKNLSDFKEISKLRDIILILANRIGSKLDITKIAGELSLSRETIYNYLYFLEKTYFISLISKYSKSPDRSIAGRKKIYFNDVGLANFLGRISLGQSFENSIYQNLRVYFNDITYYQGKGGGEIDFIVDKKIALESKISVSSSDLSILRKSSQAMRLKDYYLISLNYFNLDKTISAIDL